MVATFPLVSERERDFAIRYIQRTPLDGRNEVVIKRRGRTDKQNRMLHASLSDIAEQLPWPKDTGELHDVTWWKRRATLGWMNETKMHPEVIESLDGEDFGFLLPHTSDLSTEQLAALNEWVWAFGATNGVVFKEPEKRPEPPPEAYQ
jgi:hypothetical protein